MLERGRLGGAGLPSGQPHGVARRRRPRVRDAPAARPRRLPALPRRAGGRGRRGEEGRRDADRGRVAEREVRRRAAGRARARDRGRAAVRLRVDGDGDPVHEPARPGLREPRRCSRSTGPRRWPAGSTRCAATRPRRRSATACARCPTLDADRAVARRSSRAIAQPRALARREPPAGADPDGDRRRARRSRRRTSPTGSSSTRDARRILFLVDRANLGRQTLQGVPEVHDAGRRAQVHRALQRPAPALERDRPGRRASRSRRSSGSTRSSAATRSSTPSSTSTRSYELATEPVAGRVQPGASRPRRSTS